MNIAEPQIREKIRTIQVVEPQIMEKNKNNPGFTAEIGEIGKRIMILCTKNTLNADFSEIF